MSQWRDALHDSAFDSAFEEGNFQGARGWKGDEIKRYKGHDADDSGWDFVHVKTPEEDNYPEGPKVPPSRPGWMQLNTNSQEDAQSRSRSLRLEN